MQALLKQPIDRRAILYVHQRLNQSICPVKGIVFFQVLRPAAAGGGPSGRLAAVGGGMRPIAAIFLAAPTPRCGRWVGGVAVTAFLVFIHHIIVIHRFSLFFIVFSWFYMVLGWFGQGLGGFGKGGEGWGGLRVTSHFLRVTKLRK